MKKLKTKLWAVFMTALLLFSLPLTTAFASLWDGLNEGITGPGNIQMLNPPYGPMFSNDNFAWRVNLYVSANPDGKINKASDRIGSQQLPLVGSVLCTSSSYDMNDGSPTYLQTNYTDTTRDSFDLVGAHTVTDAGGNILGTRYALPTLRNFITSETAYIDASGNTVVVNHNNIKMFDDQWRGSTNFSNVDTRMKNKDESSEFVGDLFGDIKTYDNDFYNKLAPAINPQIISDMTAKKGNLENFEAVNKFLLPTSDDCLVEWAMVITPIYRFYILDGAGFPYLDTTGTFQGAVAGDKNIAMDAYWMAQYNATSYALHANKWFTGTVNQGTAEERDIWMMPGGATPGILYRWLIESSGAAASAAYCSEEGTKYLGVYTHHDNYSQSQWASLLFNNAYAKYYAAHGGIAVYTTEISEPEKPIYYHIYTYTLDEDSPPDTYNPDTTYSQEDLLKFIDKLPDPVVEVQTSSQSIKDITGNYYVPANDTEVKALGIPVAAMSPHPSLNPQPGKCEEYPTYGKPDAYLQKYPGGVGASEPTTVNPLADTAKLVVKKGVEPTVTLDPKEFHVKIVNVVIKEKTPPAGPSTGTDRIKSQDVTQFIEITAQSNDYNKEFSSYANDNPDNFNTSQGPFTDPNRATHKETDGVWITSIYKPAPTKDDVHDIEYLTGSEKIHSSANCSVYVKDDHPSSEYFKDPVTENLTTTCTKHHHKDCNWSCPAEWSTCHWTKESVQGYFGIQKPKKEIQRYELRLSNKVTQRSNWDPNCIIPSSSTYANVGVTVPKSYYAYKDVVKAADQYDNDDSGASKYNKLVYVLPNRDNIHAIDVGYYNIKAKDHAVFDVLMKDSDSYWIQYKGNNGANIVGEGSHQQYTKFDKDKDIKADWTNPVGDGKFDWMSSGTPIDAVEFIAHRDLLSADDVSTSLAVSGYMAKYADKSHTYGYLDFMRKAGFTFRGVSNLSQINNPKDATKLTFDGDAKNIGHENRVVWVANAADVADLKGSRNGLKDDEYNTNFVGGKDNKENPNARQKCHFGLGGLADDGADIFARIEDKELNDSSLKTSNAETGDAVRTIYYVSNKSEGKETDCFHKVRVVGEPHAHTGCHGSYSHPCDKTTEEHNTPHISNEVKCNNVLNRTIIAKDISEIYIDTMDKNKTHKAYDIEGHSQTGAISKIEASRIAFEIALGVEGTTAGQYDGVNSESGLKYDPTDANGEIVDNYQLTIDSSDNTLILKHNSDNNETKSWKENTFEICHANYQSVGEAKKVNKANRTFAEYHFTTPTRDLLFNPSYYMLYDDDFSDANKSVWMLSEQKRKVNFKDILSVRLTQSGGDDSGTPANEVYPTHVSSEWSTDLADTKCHNETNLPVAKAGNAIKATTEKSGGTVTMYVVLQDPDFTANPTATKNANNAIMADYQKQAQNILKQFRDAASSNGAAMTAKGAQTDALSMAMYSNVTNLSSLNSGYRVEDIATGGQALLNDKEPLRFTKDTKLDFKVTTGDKGTSNAGLDNWSFFAMPGYEVKHLGGNSAQDRNTDISDTTTAKLRKLYINSSTYEINNLNDASAWQKNTINELNNRLCMLMVPQDKRDSATLNYPKNTTPYLKPNTGDFNWYAEDYEGFIVGVYEIEFEISGKANSEFSGSSNNAIETEFSTIYRSESDWRTDINKLATKDGHDLTVYTSQSYQGLNISNFMSSNMNTKVNDQRPKYQVQLSETNGEMRIVTEAGVKTLKGWAKIPKINLSNHAFAEDSKGAAGVYGIGLELANLNVSFGSITASKDRNVDVIGGNNGEPFSFYYQPTYFHIRGSVYDTAR